MTSDRYAALVARAGAGDAEAFTDLVGEFGPDVLRLCMVITTDRGLAEEAAQLAWRQAWRRIRTVRKPGSLRSWLLRVAANEAKQVVRGRRQRREEDLQPATLRAARHDDPQEFAGLRDALRALDPSDREILALRHLFGFTSEEIGARVGLSAAGVRTRLKRVRDHLSRELRSDD